MAERSSNRCDVEEAGDYKLEVAIPSTVRQVELPPFNYPLLPYPDDAFMAGKTKSDLQVRIRSSDKGDWGRSYESLRKGFYDDELAEMGLPWDCQRVGAYEQTVKDVDRKQKARGRAVKRKKSRTLVKFRQPGDMKAREI